jgi:hypothetical protein
MDLSFVIERFLLLSSIESADDKIRSLCRVSAEYVQNALREDTAENDVRVIDAAACDAFYRWVLLKNATDPQAIKSFRAGDITVEGDLNCVTDAALKLRNEAFESLKGLIDDKGFYFGEVLIDDVGPTF